MLSILAFESIISMVSIFLVLPITNKSKLTKSPNYKLFNGLSHIKINGVLIRYFWYRIAHHYKVMFYYLKPGTVYFKPLLIYCYSMYCYVRN